MFRPFEGDHQLTVLPQKHGECSESFYRKEVELDVKNAPSANVEEKRRMMELLQRFEEDSLDDSPLLGGSDNEDDDDEDGLHHRLQNVDLGILSRCPYTKRTSYSLSDAQILPPMMSFGTL